MSGRAHTAVSEGEYPCGIGRLSEGTRDQVWRTNPYARGGDSQTRGCAKRTPAPSSVLDIVRLERVRAKCPLRARGPLAMRGRQYEVRDQRH